MNSALAAGLQIAVVVAVLAIAYVPLGDYMARTFAAHEDTDSTHDTPSGGGGTATLQRTRTSADLRIELLLYRLCRIDPRSQQAWVGYTMSLLGFSAAGVLFLYVLQRVQGVLPLNGGLSGVSPSVAFNTAISFVANTNWQSYVPETTMSNLTQPLGLAVQNFVSAAFGLAVAVAVVRG